MPARLRNLTFVICLLSAALWPLAWPAASSSAQASSFAASTAAPSAANLSDPAELEAFLDGAFAAQMQAEHVVGAVVAVVKNGQLFFSKGYGYADLQSRSAVDPATTLFRPGSVSKLFVWTAVMQLVEQGKLSLDTDVNQYLDFKIPDTYPQPVTMRNLLTHTPGFEDAGQDLFKLKDSDLQPLDAFLKTHIPARVYPPGQVIAYSNYGAALAGYIVERVAKMSFVDYANLNILQTLGMVHSTFRQPLPAALAGEMSQGYNYTGGAYQQGSFEYVLPYPAGSLSASAEDIAHFMIAHLQDGQYQQKRILKETTAQTMHSQLFTPDPRLHDMAYGFFETLYNGQRLLSHGGDTLLFHSGLFLLPDQQVGLFISTNSTGGGKLVSQVSRAFFDRYFPNGSAAKTPAPSGDAAARRALLEGEYYASRSNFTGFEKIISPLSPVSVSVDPAGYVLLNLNGEVSRYVDMGQGLLLGSDDPNRAAVVKEGAPGEVTLLVQGPFELFKTPWYGTTSTLGLIIALSLLSFVVTLLAWLGGWIGALARRQPDAQAERQRNIGRLARLVGVLFGLAYLAFVLGFVGLVMDMNPAFGVPNIFFGAPASMNVLMALPLALLALGVLMAFFSIETWVYGVWSFGGRLWYFLLTLQAAALLWAMYFWNLLL